MLQERTVIYGRPDHKQLREEGWNIADMHFHSEYSDSFSKVEDILKLAEYRGTGVAITDHNLIAGVEKAYEMKKDQLVIPGIEISSKEGPHILVYFYDLDNLREFWSLNVKPYIPKSPWLSINRTIDQILDSTEGANCVVSAAHPMGYMGEYRGIQQGFEKGRLSEETVKRFDAYEVIGGTMTRSQNVRSKHAADGFGLGYTGGTDGHRLGELGHIITCSKSQDIEGFLNDIKNGKTSVYGREEYFYSKFLHAFTSLSNFVRYLPSSVNLGLQKLTGKY